MPLYDYECYNCDYAQERVEPMDGPKEVPCAVCGGIMRRIISASGRTNNLVDSPWLHSVLEVVDKSGKKRHCVEFLKNPTRDNYHSWMRGEGIRPLDPGEKTEPGKGDRYDTGKGSLHDRLLKEKFMERNRIEL